MKKAYGYYRYSSHNQDGGNSINAQRNAVREFAKANNIEIVSEYVDKACSGTTPYRNGYQKMLSDLEKNPDVKCVMIHFFDRMFRNTREQLDIIFELTGKNVSIRDTKGLDSMNPEDRPTILDEACQAEKYSLKLSDETRRLMPKKRFTTVVWFPTVSSLELTDTLKSMRSRLRQ